MSCYHQSRIVSHLLPDLDRLRTWRTFAEALSFTRAAERLGMSQPGVHAQVRKLGEDLGVALYRKEGRALRLTAQGLELLAFAREAERREADLLARLRGEAPSQPAVIAAGEGALLYLIDGAIRRHVRAGAPPPRLLQLGPREVAEALLTGCAQLGVLPAGRVPEDLEAEPLASVAQKLVCPASHPLADQEVVRAADLSGARLVVPPPERPLRRRLEEWLRAQRWTVAVEVTGWPLAMHCVSLGLGLAVVNDYCRLPRGLVAAPLPELPPVDLMVARRGTLHGAAADLWRRLVGA